MRRSLVPFIFLAILAVLAAPKLISRQQTESAGPATAQESRRALRVSVEEVQPMHLAEELATTGTLRADEQVELVSEVAGRVTEILFDEGARVQRGQVLLRLDSTELEAELAQRVHRLELAKQREGRRRQLRDEGVVSQDDYDFARNQLEVLRSEMDLIRARLEKTELRAPFSGRIGLRAVSPGSYLSPQTPIATLQDLNPMKVEFTVPEQYATRLGPGQIIEFAVKGHAESFEGTVYAIEPGVDSETRSLTLRARCPNPDGILRPGSFADVRLVVEEASDALAVPSLAVVPELGGKKVFVLANGKAEARQVETGIRTAERVQITSGLAAGEQVITSAIQQMRSGLEVEAAE